MGVKDYLGDGILRNNILSEIGDSPSILTASKTFSEKSNYLVINTDEISKSVIKKAIEDTFSQMRAYSGTELEFVLVDKNNSPIGLSQFLNGFGVILNEKVMEDLSNRFSIILSKKDNVNRINLLLN